MDGETATPRRDTTGWELDQARTRDGGVIPVRATARRPTWTQLPVAVRYLIERSAGAAVVSTASAGTGFTPGFASSLDLADGRRIFVKAASSADDRRHGWPLSAAYREEVRKRLALPDGIGAPALLWHHDVVLADEQWLVIGFAHVAGAPPRRPWRERELHLVLDKLAATAPAMARVPAELGLARAEADLCDGYWTRLDTIRAAEPDQQWLHALERLGRDVVSVLHGDSIVHLDLRDDNVLIGTDETVWFVDWNWPAVGAPWIDLVCILLSAWGDGIDTDRLLADHPLTRDVERHAIDCLLAALWSSWAVAQAEDVPVSSPHLRDHQSWYADVTRDWLTTRLSRR